MSIKPTDFFHQLTNNGIEFFTGVPDSLLKEFCLCVNDNVSDLDHIITANEGNAIALAAGNYMAKKSIPLVYMQNSGLGNAINPLLSLCDPDVYSIPLIVMIGWRGEPKVKDEPQHIKQGKIQLKLLESMEIPYEIISKEGNNYKKQIVRSIRIAESENRPFVLLIKKGTFGNYISENQNIKNDFMKREKALEIILEGINNNTIIVSTTGKTSREIYEIREKSIQSHQRDFLTVGSMGHCSSIALGIALAKPQRKVVCIDGDGSLIMHMGSLATISSLKPNNYYHILLNNAVHDSVGGQETAAKNIDLSAIVKAIEFNKTFLALSINQLKEKILKLMSSKGPSFLEVKISPGSRKDLGRPSMKPIANKESFMRFIDN
tara:strand:+ start:45752 stop:46882 length:1131 start_codon:yes stop_codon:yes gene_type:complete